MRKIAIVTGANRGIGKEVARQLMQEDVFVILGARDVAKGEAAAEEIRGRHSNVAVVQLDVTDEKSVRACVRTVEKEHGAPAILVNNAGVYPEKSGAGFAATDDGAWRLTLETNLLGAVRMCREVVPHMKRASTGRIVNVSSQMGQLDQMGAGSPAYRTSKAALNAFTRALAAELSGSAILVNCLHPGWVRTDMGGPQAPRSIEEGADTAVWLCLLPPGGPTGGFFKDRKPFPW